MKNELVVTKANSLVEASYRLNISEQRILALLIAQISPDDADFKPYRFRVSELEELIETKAKNEHYRVKDITYGLLKRTLQIHEADGLLQVNWLCTAKYFDGAGEVELQFSPKLKPYLLRLQERFTSYKLANVIKLRSRHSVRLYELLKAFVGLEQRQFEFAELRKILCLGETEYPEWRDFKRRVLDQAQKELPKKTDIVFSYTTKKRGRAVAFIQFKIWNIKREKSSKKKEVKSGPSNNDFLKCWNTSHGSCGATWTNHKEPSSDCHWCPKFEKQRAIQSAAGNNAA